jgi:hypothetical protein
LLFPAEGRNHIKLSLATVPISKHSVQDAFHAALNAMAGKRNQQRAVFRYD